MFVQRPLVPRGGASQGECGAWIIRDGMSQEVHRDSRGVKLEPGDEIHFGQAIVKFEMVKFEMESNGSE